MFLKVISFNDSEVSYTEEQHALKLKLIEKISIATNQQTPVLEADRRANDAVQVELQKLIFDSFGLYYERKRGEFSDGLSSGYIKRDQIIDREEFLRCVLALVNPARARSIGASIFFSKGLFDVLLPSAGDYRRLVFAYIIYDLMDGPYLMMRNVSFYAKFAIVCVANHYFSEEPASDQFMERAREVLNEIVSQWRSFEDYALKEPSNRNRYFVERVFNGETQVDANWQGYYKGGTLLRDLNAYFFNSHNE